MWRPWFITVQPARSTGRRRSPFPVRPFLLHYHQRFSSFTSSPLFRLLACVVHIPWPVYSIFVIRLSFLFFYTYAVLFHSSFPIRHAFGVSDSPKTHPSFLSSTFLFTLVDLSVSTFVIERGTAPPSFTCIEPLRCLPLIYLGIVSFVRLLHICVSDGWFGGNPSVAARICRGPHQRNTANTDDSYVTNASPRWLANGTKIRDPTQGKLKSLIG